MATPGYPSVSVNTTLNPLQQSTTGILGEATAAFALPYNRGPIRPTLITSWQQFVLLYGGFNVANGSLLHYGVYQFFNNGGSSCFVLRVPNSDATESVLAIDGIGSDISTPIMSISASSPGAWGNQVYVQIAATGVSGRFNFTVFNGGTAISNQVEAFVDLSMNPADPRYLGSVVNSPISGSQYISVVVSLPSNQYIAGQTDPSTMSATALAGGSDGSVAPALGTAVVSGLSQLQNQILNVNLPGWSTVADLNTVVQWANSTQQAFVVVDPPFGGLPLETPSQVAANAIALVNGSPAIGSSVNAAVYSPWLNIVDPSSAVPGATTWAPPGGAVLGVYSNFLTVYGVQQTPAGINATVGAVTLEGTFSSSDLTNLQNAQINAIRQVPGSGFCVMGGRTMMPGYPNQFIAVQRTLQQFIHDFKAITQYALFQPNNASLWGQVQSTLTNYLTQQMQSNVLAGNTPATSFSVVCDGTNNTAASAQAGVLNASVAVALSSPAEFIIINLAQYQGETTATVSQ